MTVPTSTTTQRRGAIRKKSDAQIVRLQLKDRMGNPRWVTADLRDISESGIGISIRTPLAAGLNVVVRGKFGEGGREVVSSATVKWCTEKIHGNFHAGLELADRGSPTDRHSQPAADPEELDCYEIMQLSPNADVDTIQRVYRILAQRYHPDSLETGNKEIFLKLCEAHRTLGDPERRTGYDARYLETQQLHWKIFDRVESANGPEAEQLKRQGILELLYAKTIHDPERATMTVFEFEQLLGCPREHLAASLWFLRGKDYVKRGDNGRFAITVAGFDEVESRALPSKNRKQRLLEPAGQNGD